MKSFGVYYGDEEWVLKGIGQDLAHALAMIGVPNHLLQTTEKVFRQKRLNTDFHIFVHVPCFYLWLSSLVLQLF